MKIAYPLETPESDCALMAMRGSFSENAAVLERIGYQYVELLVRDADALEETDYSNILQAHHLTPIAISTAPVQKQDGLTLLSPDVSIREQAVLRLKSILRLAEHWNVPVSIGKFRGNSGTLPGTQMEDLASILHELSASSHAIIAIEAQQISNINNLNTLAEIISFCQKANSGQLCVHADTFHMAISETDPCASIADAADKLVFVHAAGDERGLPNEKLIPILRTILQSGFNGGISAEIRQQPDSIQAATQFYMVMNHLLKKLEE